MVRNAVAHLRDVAQSHHRRTLHRHDGIAHLLDVLELTCGQNEILLVILLQAADRLDLIDRAQPVRNIHKREVVGQQSLWIDNDGNFPRVAGLHFNLAHARHTTKERPQHVESFVAQVGPGNVAIQNEAEHRKN